MGVSTLIFDQKWNTTMHCSQEMEVLMDICVGQNKESIRSPQCCITVYAIPSDLLYPRSAK